MDQTQIIIVLVGYILGLLTAIVLLSPKKAS